MPSASKKARRAFTACILGAALASAAALRTPLHPPASRAPLQLPPAHFAACSSARPAAVRCAAPRAAASSDGDSYAVLGVPRDATAAQIKQAYRRLALRTHPDVNKAPDAQAKFATIAAAYAVLSDPAERAKYDRQQPGSYASTARPRRDSAGYSYRPPDPAAAAAAAERARRWREENPTPAELGDSFGSLLGDVVSAVGKAVGGGDWLSLLDELESEGPELSTLLRSRDLSLLSAELDSCRFVQRCLKPRIERLVDEVASDEADAAKFAREAVGRSAAARSVERELRRDIQRRRRRLEDARRFFSQSIARERRIAERIEQVRSGPPPPPRAEAGGRGASGGSYRIRAPGGTQSLKGQSSGRGSAPGTQGGRRRQLPSVDDELRRMKKDMGL